MTRPLVLARLALAPIPNHWHDEPLPLGEIYATKMVGAQTSLRQRTKRAKDAAANRLAPDGGRWPWFAHADVIRPAFGTPA